MGTAGWAARFRARTRLVLVFGILLGAVPARAAESSLAEFVAKVLAEGKPGAFPAAAAKQLGVAKGSRQKSVEAAPAECADGFERSFSALVGRSTSAPQGRELLLKAYRRDLKLWEVERVLLRLTPDGTLRKAVVGKGDLTLTGADKKGSFIPRELAPGSAEAQGLLKRELDFWLLGTGRLAKPSSGGEKPGRHSGRRSSP